MCNIINILPFYSHLPTHYFIIISFSQQSLYIILAPYQLLIFYIQHHIYFKIDFFIISHYFFTHLLNCTQAIISEYYDTSLQGELAMAARMLRELELEALARHVEIRVLEVEVGVMAELADGRQGQTQLGWEELKLQP